MELTEKVWAQIIAKAWKDEAYKKKLLNDPEEAMREFNVEVPQNQTLKVTEEGVNEKRLMLPHAPVNSKQLSEAALEKLAATQGGCNCQPSLSV